MKGEERKIKNLNKEQRRGENIVHQVRMKHDFDNKIRMHASNKRENNEREKIGQIEGMLFSSVC